jgi:hypothetical protein
MPLWPLRNWKTGHRRAEGGAGGASAAGLSLRARRSNLHRVPRNANYFQMRQILHTVFARLVTAAFVAIAGSAPATAQIQGPPGLNSFCAMYDDGSALDCSFPTYAACRAAISGVGGSCQANNLPRGRYAPQRIPQLIPTDPFGLYRDRGYDLPPMPPPP